MSFRSEAEAVISPRPRRRLSLQTLLVCTQIGLLALIVAGFGVSTYFLVRRGVFEQAESDLLGAVRLTMERMNQDPRGHGLEIDAIYAEKFGLAPRDHAYLFVKDSQGAVTRRGVFPEGWQMPAKLTPDRRPFHARAFQHHLEVWIATPEGQVVLVGRPLAKEFDRLNRLLLSLSMAGLVCLAVGIGLSFVIARWVVSPLGRLAQDAEAVTPDRLDQQLASDTRVSEISRLTGVLNSMLSRLDAAFRRQVRFTADASHELRTPVTIIMSQAEHALAKPRSDVEYRFALETCLSAGRSMRSLIENLLAVARSENVPSDVPHLSTPLHTLVAECCSQLQFLASERGVRLQHEVREATVLGDPSQLRRVIENLITNAILYNRPAGTVDVQVETDGTQTVLKVTDTGIGISNLDQQRLFERFFRADAARSHDRGQGAGLGLSIVQEIVRAHHGLIEVTSELGRGTCVTVRFPLTANDRNVSPANT